MTSTKIDAVNPNAATYDTHVNTAIDLSAAKEASDASITWKALVATLNDDTQFISLFTADASDSIYNLNGDKVADNSADIFYVTLDRAIMYGEAGTNVCGASNEVWSVRATQ